jgi:transcriptional regulator with XRE-family HTH domain
MSLGIYLRKLRDERDLSLREFARRLRCSAPFISDIELGRRYPSDRMLEDIAVLLGTSVEDLKTHDDRPPTEEMKKLIAANPRYALAFRTVVDRKVSPEDLLKLAKRAGVNDTQNSESK